MENEEKLELLKENILEIVCEIDEICTEYNISYVIVGGTALGAVRHNGFIPWDDDIDIAMPRDDYNRFIELSEKILPEELHFKDISTDDSYYLPFGKVCKKGTKYVTELDSLSTSSNEIFVDVFPLDNAKSPESILLKFQANIVKGLKAVIIRKKKMKLQNTSIYVKILQIVLFPFSIKRLMTWQKRIMEWNNKDDSCEYYVNLGSNYSFIKQTMKKETYFPSRGILFEDKVLQGPNKIERYLRRIYGDNFMDLPPLEKRVTHKIVKLEL